MANVSRSIRTRHLRAGTNTLGLWAPRRWRIAIAAALCFAGSGIAAAAANTAGWTNYRDNTLGYNLSYPAKVFQPRDGDPTAGLQGKVRRRSGRIFQSRDGKAWLQVAAFDNADGIGPEAYRERVIKTSYAGTRITYQRSAPGFFILSGFRGSDIFYERVMLGCGGRVINVWTLTYPTSARGTYDRIVEGIADTFRPGNERCS